MATIPDELSSLHDLGKIDFKSLEAQMRENADKMKKQLENIKIHTKRNPQISFDLECTGLSKFKNPMTTRSNGMKGTFAEIHALPMDHKAMTEMMDVLKIKLEKMVPAFTRIATIGPGIGCLHRMQAKRFPLIPPPGTKVLIVDSLSELQLAEKALRLLGQVGISANKAGKNLREALLKMDTANKKKQNKFNNQSDDVLYSRQQSQKWAYKYSHKLSKKL